jgi:hypothetical protein
MGTVRAKHTLTPFLLLADLLASGAFNRDWAAAAAEAVGDAMANATSPVEAHALWNTLTQGAFTPAQLVAPGVQLASLTLTQLAGLNFDQKLNELAAQLNIPRDQLVMILGPNMAPSYYPRSAAFGLSVYNFGEELEELDFERVQVINAALLTSLDLYRPGLEDQSAPVVIGQETYISAGVGYWGNGSWQGSWPNENYSDEIEAARVGQFVRGGGFVPAEPP